MVSILTTSTVSIVTTAALAGSAALIIILILFALLVQKELAISSSSARLQRLSRALNVALVPLSIAFLLIAITKVIEVLR